MSDYPYATLPPGLVLLRAEYHPDNALCLADIGRKLADMLPPLSLDYIFRGVTPVQNDNSGPSPSP